MLLTGNIGQQIRKARRELGLSIHDLAKRTGISTATISDLENDKRKNPRRETVEKLVEALGLSEDLEHGSVGGPLWMVRDGLFQLGLSGRAIAHIMGDVAIWQSIENVNNGGESDDD